MPPPLRPTFSPAYSALVREILVDLCDVAKSQPAYLVDFKTCITASAEQLRDLAEEHQPPVMSHGWCILHSDRTYYPWTTDQLLDYLLYNTNIIRIESLLAWMLFCTAVVFGHEDFAMQLADGFKLETPDPGVARLVIRGFLAPSPPPVRRSLRRQLECQE